MSEEQGLHESHRWGQRRYEGAWIPVCLDCRVDGFEDEPQAFEECAGPPVNKTTCPVTKNSWDDPGHTHRCLGGSHPKGMHFCPDCRQWFGVKP